MFNMNEEKKSMDTHLDCLQMFNQVKSVLTISKEDYGEKEESDIETVSLFLHGFSVATHDSYQPYVAPIVIEDQIKDCYYPLFFYDTKREGDTMKIYHRYPQFNPLVISLFTEIGIDIINEFKGKDPIIFIESIQEKLESKRVFNRVKFHYVFLYFKMRIAQYLVCYPFLLSYSKGEEIPSKYLGLFKELKTPVIEQGIKKLDFGFNVRLQRAEKRLDSYGCAKISYQDKDAFSNVLLTFVDEFIRKKENVLFVVPKEEKKEFLSFLSKQGLSSFCFLLDDLNANKIISAIETPLQNELSEEEKNQINAFLQIEEKYISFVEKKYDLDYLKYFKGNEKLFTFLVEHYNHIEYMPPFDVVGYTRKDFEQDYELLNLLPSLTTIKNSYLSNHPYFGLTASPKEENYQNIQFLISNLIDQITKLKDLISQNLINEMYHIRIQTFQELDDFLGGLMILYEYNGFPRKYFKMDQSNSKHYSLIHLKRRYQTLSSAKLMVDNFFEESIYQEDINKLTNDYESGFLLKKLLAKRKILSYFKLKKVSDFSTIFRVLKSYVIAQMELNGILPMYQDVYGDNVLTMNGVVEIESNIAYIHKFNAYGKEHPIFQIDNPFVKRYLKDKDFRVNIRIFGKEISHLYEDIKHNINQLIGYFLEQRKDYSSHSFEETVEYLTALQKHTLTEFMEYATYHEKVQDTSISLQLALRSYQKNKFPLTHARDEILFSLIVSQYEQGKKKFEPYQNSFDEIELSYLESLSHYQSTDVFIRYQNVLELIKESFNNTNFAERLNVLKNTNFNDEYEVANLLLTRYPFGLVSEDETYFIPDNIFDHVIILDSGFFHNLELLSAFRCGKDVVIINDRKIPDNRTQGYHDTLINRDVIYKSVFDFSILSTSFISTLEEDFSLIQDERFPLISTYENMNLALLPDIVLTHEHDIHFLTQLARFLAKEENLVLEFFDTQEYLFGKIKK